MLTVLQQKLAEAHGLAIAAAAVTRQVEERIELPDLRDALAELRADAEETRARCLVVERKLPEELFDELRAHANSTHERAVDLVGAWFKAGTDPIQAWSFLAMAEAGEVAVWSAVTDLAVRGGMSDVAELAAWALPIQERHLSVALVGAPALARRFEPEDPRWG
ncbi:MAG TPA: hypothetical protein VFB25_13520 [Gaiellaceae bacterium]|nr:hypothetical protein [Gaiellaceae bacterium]